MKVSIKGKGHVELTARDYVAEGGQGKIYSKGNLVYKIYHDPDKMIPEAKIQELSVLTEPNIIKPEDVLCNTKNKVVGYTMRFVPDTHPLCKIFTKAFRQREGVSDEQILKLVQLMQKTVQHIHSHKILIVDLNEMNFLASSKLDDVYFIDVDSYQTKSFPATVLMESVRDRHMKGGFTELTDWFSFAIVTFQIFIGIHPYKGKHSKYSTLDERMQHNISVLNKGVSIPAVCNSFSVIPKEYLEWYSRLFEKGERLPPPFGFKNIVAVAVKVSHMTGSDVFDIAEIEVLDKDIVDYFYSNDREVILTQDGVYCNGKKVSFPGKNPVFGFTPKMNRPVGAYIVNEHVKVCDLLDGIELYQFSGKSVMEYGGRIYVQSDSHILELEFVEGQKVMAGFRQVANCLEKSTQMFDGVVIQNLLGSYFASFFPSAGNHVQIPIKELNGCKVLDAKYDRGVLMVVVSKSGKYDRLVLKFDSDWNYAIRVVGDVAYAELNFTVLDNGICVCINEDEKLEIFSNSKDKPDIKEVSNSSIDSNMKLFHRGTKLLFAKANKLYSMSMKK